MTKTVAQLYTDNPVTTPNSTTKAEVSHNGVSGAMLVQSFARLVDLGVVHAVGLLAGPQTLYTPAAGTLVMLAPSIDSFVNIDSPDMIVRFAPVSMATPTSVDPYLLKWDKGLSYDDAVVTQTTFLNRLIGDGSALRAYLTTNWDAFPILSTSPAWAANHAYAINFLILGPDNHIWSASTGGTSGGSIPNFAANEGGTVADGSAVWQDQGVIPTTGTLHLYALVATP